MSARFRPLARDIVAPAARIAARSGIPPNGLTVLGLVSALLACLAFHLGNLAGALAFIVLMGLLDVLDGAVARELDAVTDFGGFFDSVLDRYADGAVLLGIGLYLDGYYPLVVVTLIGFFMVSYTRARAENVMDGKCDVGFAERAERLIIIMAAVVLEMWGGLGTGTALVYSLAL
ncbi:MAG: CDP-alcohol phosphatidyltransferase family protein, partial [Euryarchaeota archaeon]|nr:CDP-alcohol phosphatidyltransferase family protein [Euryarchaeota archaeon]